MSDTRLRRYLPVQVAGQNFAISMHVVLAVQQTAHPEMASTPTPSAAASAISSADTGSDTVPTVDLGFLFGGDVQQDTSPPAAPQRYAIVVATPSGSCALLVDTIHAIHSVEPEALYDLPYLVTLTGCPFETLISVDDTLLPVVDVARLVDRLRAVRPDLVVEVNYAG
ncbi:MAG: chemotaxis protein CheW [Chloroflexi bacterium]|nr:chemotaxis protein CheW [Chloroflexota bacterium]